MIISELFIELIKYFNYNKIEYYIIRNYENYPAEFTGDIDIYIDLEKIKSNLNEINEIFLRNNWKIFNTLYRDWVYVIQLLNPEKNHTRRVIVIEMFNKFSWLNFEYIPISYLRKFKFEHNNITVLSRDIGYFLTFCHYFFWAGFIPEKYYTNFQNSFQNDEVKKIMNLIWPKNIIQDLNDEINKYLSKNHFVKIETIPESIYFFSKSIKILTKFNLIYKAFLNTPYYVFKSVINNFIIIFKEFIECRGKVIIIAGTKDDAIKLLYLLKKYHLFKNKGSFLIHGPLNLFISLKVYINIFRGSIAIIYCHRFNKKYPFIIRNKIIDFTKIDIQNLDINEIIEKLLV